MGSTNGRRMIKLESRDPGRNRHRYYELEREELGLLVGVRRSWGRIGGRKRCLVRYLSSVEAEREIRNLLKLRARHGYEIVRRNG